MKYHRNNAYVNHRAIPSNEFAKNMDTRTREQEIETEKSVNQFNKAVGLLKRSFQLLKKTPNTGLKSSANGFGWRAHESSVDRLEQFEYVEPITYHDESA